LEKLVKENDFMQKEIAEKFGCTRHVICKAMKKME